MPRRQGRSSVAEERRYEVRTVACAERAGRSWLESRGLADAIGFGLPEIDDRYHVWRVPLLDAGTKGRVGEVVVDAYSGAVDDRKTTAVETLRQRLRQPREADAATGGRRRGSAIRRSPLDRTIALGDSAAVLRELPAESVDLVFTSPPYYNARPEYTDYVAYEDYLDALRAVILACHRVLSEGRFFVVNVSPVLLRRESRSRASRRIAVPFDVHRLLVEAGFDFVDDIIWEKPSGAGWATGRGRRFAADRTPLQYKAVPVTEYVLVYRKHTDRLIDWNIRHHPDPEAVRDSKIEDGYERTNVWRIKPAHDRRHPAVFPLELAEKVIRYYSFRDDVILDPFAGIGTVGRAAAGLGRRFVLVELNPEYFDVIRDEAARWPGASSSPLVTIDAGPGPAQRTRS